MSYSLTRRTFLKAVVAAGAWLLLPRAWTIRPRSYWLFHKATGDYWQVDSPVVFCLANTHLPVLERAKERLLTLTPADETRIIRLVLRRCGLNLLEVSSGQVVVHYWGQAGLGELRPFFKAQHLARRCVRVALVDRKRETTTHKRGDHFFYDPPISDLADVFGRRTKWRVRCQEENATTREEQIKVAWEVLSEPCSGSIFEFMSWHGRLHGAKPQPLSLILRNGRGVEI